MERLLLRSTSLERLLLGSAGLEGLLQRSSRLEWLLLGSSLAREAGELRLKLARSLRLRLLEAWIAGELLLEGRRLSKARRLGGKGARLLLLLLLLLSEATHI